MGDGFPFRKPCGLEQLPRSAAARRPLRSAARSGAHPEPGRRVASSRTEKSWSGGKRKGKERKRKKKQRKNQKLERIFSFEILIRDIRVQAFFCQMLDPGISEEPGVQTSSGEMNRGLGL